jgi:hypothetical protein
MDKRKKKKTIILKWFFIVVFILLVVDKLVSIAEVGMGGNSLDSPNGRYVAGFTSLATGGLFATVGLSDIKRFYRFEIYHVNDKPKGSSWRYTDKNRVKCIDLDVLHRDLNIGLYGDSEYIEWSPNSSEVTFAFKDIEFKLKIDETKDERKN